MRRLHNTLSGGGSNGAGVPSLHLRPKHISMFHRTLSFIVRAGRARAPGFPLNRYAAAIALVAVATIIRLAFLRALETSVPFITFYPAVMLAALYGGFRAGILATLLSAAIADYLWIEPQLSFAISRPPDWVALSVFVTNCVFLSWVAGKLLQTNKRLRQLEAMQRDELERQVAERTAQLRETEKDLNRAQAMAQIGSWRYDPRCNESTWSDETYRLFGVVKGTRCTYEQFLAAVHPEDRGAVDRSWQSALQHGTPHDVEHRVIIDCAVKWMRERAELEYGEDGKLLTAFGTCQDITERKRAEESRKLLIGELNHRMKNTLAVIQSIAQQTFMPEDVPVEARRSFQGRIAALAAAHNLLSRTNWEKSSLADVVQDAIAFCGPACERVVYDGPLVMLNPKQALALTMALHELCTNALKHGSLSTQSGSVDLRWSVQGGWLEIVWRESGGPPVQPPGRRSFGSMMIEQALPYELCGEAAMSFNPDGVVCVIKAPIAPL